MFYRRRIDPSAHLVLWQIGVAGDRSTGRTATGPGHRRLLLERLLEDYPPGHPTLLYEAATLPIARPRIDGIPLEGIVEAELGTQTTWVLPPARPLERDEAMLDRITALDRSVPIDTINKA